MSSTLLGTFTKFVRRRVSLLSIAHAPTCNSSLRVLSIIVLPFPASLPATMQKMSSSGVGTVQVVCPSYGRTGTLSMKAALEILGFGPCYHSEICRGVRPQIYRPKCVKESPSAAKNYSSVYKRKMVAVPKINCGFLRSAQNVFCLRGRVRQVIHTDRGQTMRDFWACIADFLPAAHLLPTDGVYFERARP